VVGAADDPTVGDAAGVVSPPFDIPLGVETGEHAVELVGLRSGRYDGAAFRAVAGAVATPAAHRPGRPLAATGFDQAGALLVAGGLVLTGAVPLAGVRVRRVSRPRPRADRCR